MVRFYLSEEKMICFDELLVQIDLGQKLPHVATEDVRDSVENKRRDTLGAGPECKGCKNRWTTHPSTDSFHSATHVFHWAISSSVQSLLTVPEPERSGSSQSKEIGE